MTDYSRWTLDGILDELIAVAREAATRPCSIAQRERDLLELREEIFRRSCGDTP